MLDFGIIGTNFISEWFTAACAATGGRATVTAVCSRDLNRAEQFAEKAGIAGAFDVLDAMFDTIDAVYVASPVAAHHDQALRAIAAGKHVLVEKTMGASLEQTEEILAAAQRAGVVAMEAVRNLHTPAYRLIHETLADIGTVRYARIEKLQYSSRYDRFRAGEHMNAFDPELGNSALADIGVYCLQPALDLFGIPAASSGASVWLDNGFEAGGSLQLAYGSAAVDVVYSKIATGVAPSAIYGEEATIVFDDPAETSQVRIITRGGATRTLLQLDTVPAAQTMSHEILDFARQVARGETDARWADLTVASRRLMDDQLRRGPMVSAYAGS